jgi:hypothetical protein
MKISQLALIITCASATTVSFAETSFEQELQQGCAKVKQYALNGKKLYDQKQYAKAVKQFEDQAAWAHFCQMNAEESGIKVTDREIEIANNNVGLSYAKLGKPQWAKVWFLRDEDSKISLYNLKQLPKPQITKDLQGTYVRANGFGQWDYITVKKQQNKYLINFEGYYFGIRGLIYGPNLGEFDTTMPITASKPTIIMRTARLSFNLRMIQIMVKKLRSNKIVASLDVVLGITSMRAARFIRLKVNK